MFYSSNLYWHRLRISDRSLRHPYQVFSFAHWFRLDVSAWYTWSSSTRSGSDHSTVWFVSEYRYLHRSCTPCTDSTCARLRDHFRSRLCIRSARKSRAQRQIFQTRLQKRWWCWRSCQHLAPQYHLYYLHISLGNLFGSYGRNWRPLWHRLLCPDQSRSSHLK